jgi:hypothetical protein
MPAGVAAGLTAVAARAAVAVDAPDAEGAALGAAVEWTRPSDVAHFSLG